MENIFFKVGATVSFAGLFGILLLFAFSSDVPDPRHWLSKLVVGVLFSGLAIIGLSVLTMLWTEV